MRGQLRRLRVELAAALLVAGCGGAPTDPYRRAPEPVGTPSRLALDGCGYGERTTQCLLQAYWGQSGDYQSSKNVTTEAQWTSNNPGVVRVTAPATLQAVAPGDADVTMRYNGRELAATFRVFESGPPWYVMRGGPSIEYHVRVEDDRGAPLGGVLVEITGGGNAGLSAVSEPFGSAIFHDDIVCGPITARGTKDGYRTWVGSAMLCGSAGNGRPGSETIGPVRMIPLNAPAS